MTAAEPRNGVRTPAEATNYLLRACAEKMRDAERRGEHLGMLSAYLELNHDPVDRAIWNLAAADVAC